MYPIPPAGSAHPSALVPPTTQTASRAGRLHPTSDVHSVPLTGASDGIAATTAPGSAYENHALVLERESPNTSSHISAAPAVRAGVTASALRRDIHRAATGPVVPTRAARTSPSGSHSAEIFTTVPPAVPPLAVLRPSTTTSGTYSAVAVSSAGDSSVATTTAPAACGGSSHSISADDTNSLAQLDSPTKHRDAPGAKFFPSIATLRGDPSVDTRLGNTPSTSPVATVSVSPSTESSGPLPNVNVGEAVCAQSPMVATSRTFTSRPLTPAGDTHTAAVTRTPPSSALSPPASTTPTMASTAMVPNRHDAFAPSAQLASRSADVRRVVNPPPSTPSNTLTVSAPSSASSVSGVRHVVNARALLEDIHVAPPGPMPTVAVSEPTRNFGVTHVATADDTNRVSASTTSAPSKKTHRDSGVNPPPSRGAARLMT